MGFEEIYEGVSQGKTNNVLAIVQALQLVHLELTELNSNVSSLQSTVEYMDIEITSKNKEK